MFDLDKWIEIGESIRRHKLRTFLTGFGVAWGIFMLIILLGSGRSLQDGVSQNFSGYAQNSIMVFPGVTSQSFEGLPARRRISVSVQDIELLRQNVQLIDRLSPETTMNTGQVYYGNNSGDFTITGIYHEYFDIRLFDTEDGRLLNPLDQYEARNVAVVGPKTVEVLFRGEDPIGQFVNIRNNYFKIVGVFKPDASAMSFGDDDSRIFVPHSAYVRAFGGSDNVGRFQVTPRGNYPAAELENDIKEYLAGRLRFHADDPRAIRSFNMEEQVSTFNALFFGVNVFLWIIGLSTLIGGVVGVGNIMLVTVKERTREIGIRRALGATPGSILGMVIMEAVVITTISGYVGLLGGAGIIWGAGMVMEFAELENSVFAAPSIDLSIAAGATFVLILAGALAGFVPARNAAKTKPVDALRYE